MLSEGGPLKYDKEAMAALEAFRREHGAWSIRQGAGKEVLLVRIEPRPAVPNYEAGDTAAGTSYRAGDEEMAKMIINQAAMRAALNTRK